jgi:hypothetical protein|tara:strand:+ start:134 stop:325 length:192 start_codon:yes stop_codon:yes gene_type:complete
LSLKDSFKIIELEDRVKNLESKVELIFGNSESFATNDKELGIIDLIKRKTVGQKKVNKRERKK